ncbi:putative protein S-acyltransferase 7 [Dorcoceras hygrometricum]|uniref:Uncharacterized protein n=1 Tax=Dorcoceras hygrometricum TaxID=472368 RepID=A0A2Z7ADF6_9LAMI|nr:putative protein S-acyltransferase 7 [Dorcoceras hygrometricum]
MTSSRLGLRDAGIDQLNFHSVQLDYLMLLQMGNTDPYKTKAGNKYEVKPQYEELSKQINMQHAINQCYECMRLSKEICQLDRCNNRQIISCRLYTTVYQPGNHWSVIIGARQPITARRTILLHNHANPTARSILRSYTSTQALTTKNRAKTTRNAHPKAQKKQLLNLLNETSNSRTSRAYGISQLIAPSFQTSINGKSKSQGVHRHQENQKQRLDAMEIGGGKSR